MEMRPIVIMWFISGIVVTCVVLFKCCIKSTKKCLFLPQSPPQQKFVGLVLGVIYFVVLTKTDILPALFKTKIITAQIEDPSVKNFHDNCHWQIRMPGCDFACLRGENYYLKSNAPVDSLITDYNIYHFLAYFLMTFLAPSLFWAFLVGGLWWELMETFEEVKCWDITDPIYNLAGLLLGLFARNKLNEKFNTDK